MRLHMPSLIQKHAHVKGQRSNHHIFKFQPNPSWAKKRPNRYTSLLQFYFFFSFGLSPINGDQNQYQIVLLLFGAAYA